MKVVGKGLDVLEKLIRNICGALVIGFTGVTLVAVLARYVFKAPIWWSEQFCRYLFIWMLMLYFPIIVRHGQNLGFDMLVKYLPKKAQDALWLLCNVLILGFGCVYLYYAVTLCGKFSAAHKIMDGINLPAAFMYSSEAVGASLLILFSLEVVVNLAIRLAREWKEGGDK